MPTTRQLVEGATDLNAAASYSDATAPAGWAAGDSLQILDGSQIVNQNLAALVGKTLATVLIGPNFKGSIGDAGTSMTLGTITSLQIQGGGGDLFIGPGICAAAIVRGTKGGLVSLTSGTITDLSMYQGRVRATSGIIITNGYNIGATFDAVLHATGFTLFNHRRGRSNIDRAMATAKLIEGVVTAMKNASVSAALDIFGGVWDHQGGNLANVTGWGGTLMPDNARVDFSLTGTLARYKGFKFSDKRTAVTVTLPGTIKDFGFGEDVASSAVFSGASA